MRFEVIEGGLRNGSDWFGTQLFVGSAPQGVVTKIREEDGFLVLSAPPIVRRVDEHPVRTWTGIMNDEPREPGTVVWRGHELLAVVHRLEQDPSIQKQALEPCWTQAFELAQRSQSTLLAAELLGTIHAHLDLTTALQALRSALELSAYRPQAIWLQTPRYAEQLPAAILEWRDASP